MADISKCEGRQLEQCKTCYRFLAESNPYRQSYLDPIVENGVCKFVWKVVIDKNPEYSQK